MIKISTLPPVLTPEEFFSIDYCAMIDVISINSFTKGAEAALRHPGAFQNRGRIFVPFHIKGRPHNLFLKAKTGIPYLLGDKMPAIYFWDGNLKEALQAGKIFDFSDHYHRYKDSFNPFLIEDRSFYESRADFCGLKKLVHS